MGFVEDRAADAVAILAEQGQDVTYTPSGASPRTVTALWDPVATVGDTDPDGRRVSIDGVLQVAEADAATPDERDYFTIGGTDYAVSSIGSRRWVVEFRLVRSTVQRVGGGPNARIQRS